jgi:hypothetical protein
VEYVCRGRDCRILIALLPPARPTGPGRSGLAYGPPSRTLDRRAWVPAPSLIKSPGLHKYTAPSCPSPTSSSSFPPCIPSSKFCFDRLMGNAAYTHAQPSCRPMRPRPTPVYQRPPSSPGREPALGRGRGARLFFSSASPSFFPSLFSLILAPYSSQWQSRAACCLSRTGAHLPWAPSSHQPSIQT